MSAGSRPVGQSTAGSRADRPSAADHLFTVTLYSPIIYGRGAPDATVTAALLEGCLGGRVVADGATTIAASGDYSVTLERDGRTVTAVPGRRALLAAGGARAAELCVPEMTVKTDVVAGVVAGIAPPGAAVTATLFAADGRPVSVTSRADAAGAFRASFSDRATLAPGAQGIVAASVGSARLALRWTAPIVAVSLGEATVAGRGPSGRPVDLILERGGLAVAGARTVVGGAADPPDRPGASDWSVNLRDGGGSAIPVQAGDRLTARLGDDLLAFGVPQVTAEIEADRDRVSGVAPASRPLTVTVSTADRVLARGTTAGVDGFYSVSFAGAIDLAFSDAVIAQVDLDTGITVGTRAGGSGVELHLDRGVVSGRAPAGSAVDAMLLGPNDVERGRAAGEAAADGHFALVLRDGTSDGVRPAPGDRLAVSHAGGGYVMRSPALTADVDLAADRVTGLAAVPGTAGGDHEAGGRASAGRPLEVQLRGMAPEAAGWQEAVVTVPVAPDGTYAADFATRLDLLADTRLEIIWHDVAGNAARIDRRVPILHVQHHGNRVTGIAAPGAQVAAELWRAADRLSGRRSSAQADGAFDVRFVDAHGDPLALLGGDAVAVSWFGADLQPPADEGYVQMIVEPVTGTFDVDARRLSGRAPAGRTVDVAWHDTPEGPISRQYSPESGSDGSYSVSIGGGPGQPLPAGGWADVGVHDADGQRTYVWAAVPLIDVTLAESEVAGRVSPLAGVNLSLERSGTTVAHASVQADTVGAFAASLGAASTGRIAAGDRLKLEADGDPPASIDVPELTIALDRVVQVVRGRAPAGSAVSVRLFVAGHPTVELRELADAAGAWSIAADRLPDGVTIDDVLDAEVSVRVGNGHRVAARPESGRRTATATPEPSPTPTPTPVEGPSATIATPSSTAGATPTPTPEAGARAYLPSALRSPAVGGAGRGHPGP